MNAAARLLNQGTLSRGWVVSLFITRVHVSTTLFVIAILLSALSMVYVTNSSRSLHASLQQALAEKDHLQLQWGQLTLEKSTLLTEARVEVKAKNHLQMVYPEGKSMVLVVSDSESHQ